MLRLHYLWRNLARKPLRTALTAAAVGVPMLVYVLGMSLVRLVDGFLEQAAREMRLVVVHKTSIINMLPVGHRAKIAALDPTGTRLRAVCTLRWFGGRVPDSQVENYFIAVDADQFPIAYPEFNLTPAEVDAWLREKRAAVVGRAPAAAYGWTVGDTITVESTIPPFLPVEMVIVAIPRDALDSETSFLRFDYLNEELKKLGTPTDMASFFLVKCASRADMTEYRRRIDESFARTPYETRTFDEKTFLEAFISAKFDLPERLRLLSYVVVAVAAMAAANTMTMTFRDRVSEYGTLKALGFGPVWITTMLLCEALVLALSGGLLGAMIPYVAFNWTPLAEFRIPELGQIRLNFMLVLEAVAASLVVGCVSAALPGFRVAELHPVAALQRRA